MFGFEINCKGSADNGLVKAAQCLQAACVPGGDTVKDYKEITHAQNNVVSVGEC